MAPRFTAVRRGRWDFFRQWQDSPSCREVLTGPRSRSTGLWAMNWREGRRLSDFAALVKERIAMIKKTLVTVLGLGLLVGFVFGRDAFSYLATSYSRLTGAVKDSVPIEFQIDRARE